MSKSIGDQIVEACRIGNIDEVIRLTKGVDVNKVRGRGGFDIPLNIACEAGHFEVVEYLIDKRGADVNAPGVYTKPLYVASTPQIVDLLVNRRADIEGLHKPHMTPLHYACRSGSLAQIDRLIHHHAKTEANAQTGDNLIHACAVRTKEGAQNIIEYLISKGHVKDDDFKQPNSKGETPFYLACDNSSLEMVSYLAFKKGVDINEVNSVSGLTPKAANVISMSTAEEQQQECLQAGVYNPNVEGWLESARAIDRFIDTFNRKNEFKKELGNFANEAWLTDMLFQSYCSGEVMAGGEESAAAAAVADQIAS